jgi:hypothetical protein
MSNISKQPMRLAFMVWALCALSPCAALADRATDEQFPRIRHMMFVNTPVVQETDQPTGEPSEPAPIEQDDDDC